MKLLACISSPKGILKERFLSQVTGCLFTLSVFFSIDRLDQQSIDKKRKREEGQSQLTISR